MAKRLREALADREITVSHAVALELVARQLGFSEWNVLAARTGGSAAAATSSASTPILPDGWNVSGRTDLFSHAVLAEAGPAGTAAIAIASRAPHEAVPIAAAGEFLTVMQRFAAAPFRGRVVSFRASLWCEEALGSGRIWIHARGQGRETLVADNLGLSASPNGPVTGTMDWSRRVVTVQVPEAADYLGIGVLFGSGTGRFRAAELSFGDAAEGEKTRPLPDAPLNLALS